MLIMEIVMYVLAIFTNRSETIRFCSQLKQQSLNSMVISTPKGLGSSCAISVKFYYKNLNKAGNILRVGGYRSFTNFFKIINKRNNICYEVVKPN